MAQEVENQHGGARVGAGRPRGSTNRRTSVLREAIEAEGVDPAVALVRIAKDAEDREEFGLAVEAYGRVLPFLHSRPKPTEADPEALIALERALLRMKIEETADAVKRDEGLAERLARAKRRVLAAEVVEVFDALAEAAEDAQEVAAAKRLAEAKPRRLAQTPEPAQVAGPTTPAAAPEPEPPAPILPRPEPRQFSGGDWSTPRADWPERVTFVDGGSSDFDLNPYEADPNGLLSYR